MASNPREIEISQRKINYSIPITRGAILIIRFYYIYFSMFRLLIMGISSFVTCEMKNAPVPGVPGRLS